MRHQKLLRDLGWIAGIMAFSGCFNPDKNGLDGEESDATGSSTDGGGTMNDDAPEDDGPDGSGPGTDGETGPNDETTNPGTEEGTTQGETDTGSTGACGDGNVDAGELCLPSEPTTFDTAAGSRYIAVARLNPNLDIVTSSTSAFAISIMMGNGAGGFATPTTRAVGTAENNDGPLGLALGDLDDDDDVDILALSYSNLTWFLNNGAGQFSGSGTHQAGGFTSRGHVFIDNVDASPAGDIMYSDGYGICVALGALDVDNVYSISAGAESSCNQRLQICEDGFVVPTEFGFDGDGYRDLLIGAAFSSEVGQGRGNGNGTFTLTECNVGTNVCGTEQCDMSYINAADLDDDGEVDLVASHDQGISVLLGNDDGTYSDPTFHDTGASEETKFADMNGDGYLDIIVASAGESAIAVLLGTGDGDFEEPVFFAAGAEVFSVAVGDANNDDAPDLFTVHGTPDAGTVVVFLSDP